MAKDGDGSKLLNIKFYDKMMDLAAREATHLVGSRIATILGSKHSLNVFDKRISLAQLTGLTRLEVSICRDALRKYSPL